MKTRELEERREQIVTEMRAINETPDGTGGDLSATQAARFDELKAELASVETRTERQRLIDAADRQEPGESITGGDDTDFDRECRKYSVLRAIGSQVPDLTVDAGREREVSQELQRRSGRTSNGISVPMSVFQQPVEQRVLTTAAPVGGPGSNIIATDYMGAQFIDRLRAALRVRGLGATVLNGLQGDVDIPRLKASGTAGWVAENAAITAADPQFDKVQLTPKHAGAITEFSRNMLMQSSPDIESLLRDDFAKILAEAVDGVAIEGGGSNEPTGILQTSGIGSVAMGTNGAALDWDSVIDLIAEVEIDNAEGSAFLTNSRVIKTARKTAKVASTDSVMIMEGPGTLAGYPVASTNLVPSDLTKGTGTDLSALIFGNFSDLILGYWSSFDLLVNPYESTAYSKGNVQVRAMLTMDVAVRHPESFAAITDLIA